MSDEHRQLTPEELEILKVLLSEGLEYASEAIRRLGGPPPASKLAETMMDMVQMAWLSGASYGRLDLESADRAAFKVALQLAAVVQGNGHAWAMDKDGEHYKIEMDEPPPTR